MPQRVVAATAGSFYHLADFYVRTSIKYIHLLHGEATARHAAAAIVLQRVADAGRRSHEADFGQRAVVVSAGTDKVVRVRAKAKKPQQQQRIANNNRSIRYASTSNNENIS